MRVRLVLAWLLVLVAFFLTPSGAGATSLQCCGSGSGGGGASTFDAIGSGSNSTATMTCDTGCSILASGSGSIAATTAAALASNPSDCAANTYATTIAANGNLTCASITNASTTAVSTNTGSTIVLRDGSGNFSAGTISAALTGNASTASALAANPSDCSSNQFATTIAANGNLTCAQPAFTDLSGTASAAQIPLATLLAGRAGAGNDTTLSSSADGSLYGSTTTAKSLLLRANSADTTTGKIQLDAPQVYLYSDFPASQSASLPLLSSTPTTTLTGGASYNMVTSAPVITLADTTGSQFFLANGSVERTGTSESTLYDVTGFGMFTTFTSGTAGGPLFPDTFLDQTKMYQYGNASCTGSGTPRACCSGAGTGTCVTDPSTVTSSSWVPITVQSKPTLAASGNSLWTVTRATALYSKWLITAERNTDCTGGAPPAPYACCTGSGTGTCGTTSAITVTRAEGLHVLNPTKTGTGAAVTNMVGISIDDLTGGASQNTSLESLGAGVDMRHNGPARFGATGPPTTTTMGGIATAMDNEGSSIIKGVLDLGDDVVDVGASTTTSILDIRPTIDLTDNAAQLNGVVFSPTTTTKTTGVAGSTIIGFDMEPTITHSNNGGTPIPVITAVQLAGTSTTTNASSVLTATVLKHSRTYTSATANASPLSSYAIVNDGPSITYSTTSGSVTGSTYESVNHNPTLTTSGAGGSMTLTNDYGLEMQGSYVQTAGTLDVTNRIGLKFKAVTDASSVLDNNIAVDVDATTKGSVERTALRSAIAANSVAYFLHDTGGAQSSLAGKFTTYNNIATAGVGLAAIYGESGVSGTKTANFTALSYTPPATAGRYRVSEVITTTSSTNTGSLQCTVDYVDSQGTTHTADVLPIMGAAGTLGATQTSAASKEFHCLPVPITINNSATAIVLKVVITGSVSYTVAASVEQIA